MPLTKQAKAEQVDAIKELISQSKLTVAAKYAGTSVKSFQQLRRDAKSDGTTVKVVKNRLFLRALGEDERFKDIDASAVTGQLMFAFNSADEAAAAKTLADFAKTEGQVELIVGFTADGNTIFAEDLKALADLPSKEQLRGQVVGTLAAPLTGTLNVISGNLRSLINVFEARSQELNA